MSSFTDSENRRWIFEINVGSLKRLKAAGIDLVNITEPRSGSKTPLLTELEIDLLLLSEAAYGLLAPQIEKAGLTPEQFADALDGKASAAMHDAFWSALSDFFQSRGETAKTAAIAKQTQLLTAAMAMGTKKINELDTDRMIGTAFGEASSN